MQKFRISLWCLVVAISLLVLPLTVFAAYNDVTTNDGQSQIYISDLGINLRMDSGAAVTSMVVSASAVTFTMTESSQIVLRSSDRKQMDPTGFSANKTSFTCSSSESVLTITLLAGDGTQTGTVTPSSSVCSSATGSGGSTGGSPAPTVITPTNAVISINAGALQTRSREVTLTLGATNASMMTISESASFTGATWENYATSKAFTLSDGLGVKTVYVKYKSSSGDTASVVSDTIEYAAPLPATTSVTVVSTVGGNVALSDNSVKMTVPAGTIVNDASFSIAPTESYTAPETGKKSVGSQAYNMTALVGSTAVTTFNKNVTLTFKYTDDQIKGIKESTIKAYYWSATENKWVLAGGTVDAANNTIEVAVNHFTLFMLLGDASYGAGDLVKLACDSTNQDICTAVYYLGNDGKRYVFPNEKIYFTWYTDYSSVKTIGASDLASYAIGGNVNYRPGVKMVKITSDPKTYAVEKGGTLRWVKTEALAVALYGSAWNTMIDDLSDAFFFAYKIGNDVNASSDFNKEAQKTSATTINMDKGL